MRPVRSSAILALSLSVATVGLTACGGSDGGSSGSSTYADGKTFTLALSADPGALDPQGSASSPLFQVSKFAYDSLVSVNAKGQVDLAARVEVVGERHDGDVRHRIRRHVRGRCGVHRADRGGQHQLRRGPEEQEPVPRRVRAGRRDGQGLRHTLTVTLASPSPFVLNAFANLPMVCDVRHEGPRLAQGRHRRHRPLHPQGGRARATTTPTRSARATPGARTAPRPPRRACPRPSRSRS